MNEFENRHRDKKKIGKRMKGGPEKAMFFQSFPHTEEEEEEDVLKEEEEEKSVSGDPFVVVKLEDERDGQEAERSERSSGCGSALEISLFAPLDSSEDGEEERPRPLSHTPPACWPCAPGTSPRTNTHTHPFSQCTRGERDSVCACAVYFLNEKKKKNKLLCAEYCHSAYFAYAKTHATSFAYIIFTVGSFA